MRARIYETTYLVNERKAESDHNGRIRCTPGPKRTHQNVGRLGRKFGLRQPKRFSPAMPDFSQPIMSLCDTQKA